MRFSRPTMVSDATLATRSVQIASASGTTGFTKQNMPGQRPVRCPFSMFIVWYGGRERCGVIKLVENNGVIEVSFKYDAKLVARVKAIPGRQWKPDQKKWVIPKASLTLFMDRFDDVIIDGSGVPSLAKLNQKPAESNYDKTIKHVPAHPMSFKTKPYNHQVEAWNLAVTHDRILLALDMGLGKSWTAINTALYRRQAKQVKKVICLVLTSNIYNWYEGEIPTHSDETSTLISGSKMRYDKRLEAYKDFATNKDLFMVIGFESFKNDIDDIEDILLKPGKVQMVVVDECQRVKNPKAGNTKAFMRIDKYVKYVLMMSGTPVINKAEESWTCLKTLKVENRTYFKFCKDLCIMGGYGNHQVIGYDKKEYDLVKANISKVMLRRTKEQCLDLPPKIYQPFVVKLEGKQAAVYKKFEDSERADALDGEAVTAANGAAKLIKLQQIADALQLLELGAGSAKIDAIKDILTNKYDNAENKGKVIVFSKFKRMTRLLREQLVDWNPAYIDGDTDIKVRQEQVKLFQENDDCKVIIGTIGAMGTGLTLTSSDTVIFTDLMWSPAYNAQAEDRAHRIGTVWPVTIVRLVAKDTVDEVVLETLAEKEQLFNDLINQGIDAGNHAALSEGSIVSEIYQRWLNK